VFHVKKVDELKRMLYARLGELQDGKVKRYDPKRAERLRIELSLLYDILSEDVNEAFWDEIEAEIYS
jgi:hypothetical protein